MNEPNAMSDSDASDSHELESDSDPVVGDECPFCGHFNSPPADDLCEHAVAWVWDGQVKTLASGVAFESVFKKLVDLVESAGDGSILQAILEVQADRNAKRQGLIAAVTRAMDEALITLMDAQVGSGWSTNGMLGGSGHTICLNKTTELMGLTSECQAILDAGAMKIIVASDFDSSPEAPTLADSTPLEFVASGFWSEDMYHSGHVAYYIANPEPGCWVMEACERNAILDDVTEEDIEEGRLNDDQIQAMWGRTLEEAQDEEYWYTVAWIEGVADDAIAQEMAAVLYRAVREAGGKTIDEPDAREGLLEV